MKFLEKMWSGLLSSMMWGFAASVFFVLILIGIIFLRSGGSVSIVDFLLGWLGVFAFCTAAFIIAKILGFTPP